MEHVETWVLDLFLRLFAAALALSGQLSQVPQEPAIASPPVIVANYDGFFCMSPAMSRQLSDIESLNDLTAYLELSSMRNTRGECRYMTLRQPRTFVLSYKRQDGTLMNLVKVEVMGKRYYGSFASDLTSA